jgi:hypothetical protein
MGSYPAGGFGRFDGTYYPNRFAVTRWKLVGHRYGDSPRESPEGRES